MRKPGHLVRRLPYGLLALVGLGLVVLSFLRYGALHEEDIAFRSAPVCGTPAATRHPDCVRLESGWVVRKREDHDDHEVTVGREGTEDRDYQVDSPLYEALSDNSTLELRLWHGRVVSLAFQGHNSEPMNTPWLSMLWVGLLAGVGTAALVTGLSGPDEAEWVIPAALATLFSAAVWFRGSLILTERRPDWATYGEPAVVWLLVVAFLLYLTA
ncbi:hypothetical protein [Kitasatospora sp. NPDC101183]|uniref:hypothetical protein n=1 Tax=Kitasatospora sp. NPDC101183 TaxID=3364100 RepID=UPI003825372F